jgi:hypothetical protein
MQNFTKKEIALFKKLNTPAKVQDFLNTIPFNFEVDGKDVIKSPLYVMRANNAHCIEGAILGAYILSLHGHKPYIMNLRTTKHDLEHVIVPLKVAGLWGCLSKTNHAVLRYRDPVYKSIRELVMSYFNEYYLDDGTKTLRQYSDPVNLNIFKDDWHVADYDLWSIDDELDNAQYHDIAPKNILNKLRKADVIEREAGKIVDWKKDGK